MAHLGQFMVISLAENVPALFRNVLRFWHFSLVQDTTTSCDYCWEMESFFLICLDKSRTECLGDITVFFAGSCLGLSRAERPSVSSTKLQETLCLQQPKEMFNLNKLCKNVHWATSTKVLTKSNKRTTRIRDKTQTKEKAPKIPK